MTLKTHDVTDSFLEEWKKKFDFWFSQDGIELQYCLVAQGYKDRLFAQLLVIFISGFTVIKIIREIENDIQTN